ncbi:hypothetical protein RJ640_021315 [Escallonia rubra]|uniref:F-box/LRR-repeat protein 15-like leucin rich repeat domain-containing protein n=1 Tax=Escallonia rubra TaxID=112253 RepID=A0AA88S4T7_9ASTE|nr:hypothetical protein RJ640_021315 [Escallonia rubra]
MGADALSALLYLNLSRCKLTDDGCEKFSELRTLKVLNLGFNEEISDAVLVHLKGLVNLESLNLSFTVVTDGGLRKLSGLSSLKSLNLDARQITDAGLAALTKWPLSSVSSINFLKSLAKANIRLLKP